jgi:hypothetical protein
MIFDACGHGDPDALHSQALELALRRAGLRTLTLGAGTDPTRIGRALRALDPVAVVLTGRRAELDVFGRLVYAARQGERAVAVLDFRGALPDTGASTVPRLGDSALEARDRLLAAIDGREQLVVRRVRERDAEEAEIAEAVAVPAEARSASAGA